MKLHNPFRVAVSIDSFPLFLCTCLVIVAAVCSVVVFIEQYMTLPQLISAVVTAMLARVVYAVFKGK